MFPALHVDFGFGIEPNVSQSSLKLCAKKLFLASSLLSGVTGTNGLINNWEREKTWGHGEGRKERSKEKKGMKEGKKKERKKDERNEGRKENFKMKEKKKEI